MAVIDLAGLAGMIPKISPVYLAQNQAVVAENCRLDTGSVLPWRGLSEPISTLAKAGEIKTIYRWAGVPGDDESGFWFHWNEIVHVIGGAIPGDTEERVYFSGTDRPRYTYAGLATSGGSALYPVVSRPLGVPVPELSPVAVVSGDADEGVDPLVDTVNRSYVVTYRTAKGEESRPSLPSNSVDWMPGQIVTISTLPGQVVGEWEITDILIYRRESSAAGGEYFRIAVLPVTDTEFVDDVEDVGQAIDSYQYFEPPEDLHGLGLLPGGFAYGFSGNQLCLSEPYLLHAWDPDIRRPTEYDIVGGGHFGDSVVILTKVMPYIATGQDPRSMSMDTVKLNQACLSAQSITSTPYGVIFSAPDGLFIIGPNGYQNLLENYMLPEQWKLYDPASIRGVFFEDRYFAFYDNGVEQGALIVQPSKGDAGLVKLNLWGTALFADPLTDRLLVVDGADIKAFDEGSPLTIRWTSREWFFARLTGFSCVRVIARSYVNIRVHLIVDGVELFDIEVTSSQMLRTPDLQGHRFQVVVEGESEIERVTLSSQPSELAL